MAKLKLNDGISLYYEIEGPELNNDKNIHTFIFIHGAPGLVDSRLYKKFWGQFSSTNLRILFLEQRGSGRSDDGRMDKLNINQHAKDIHELCEKLGIKTPIVGGVSQGGYVSLAYAELFPNNILALILSNTEAKRETEERVAAHKFCLVHYFNKTKAEAEQIAEALRKCDANWTDEAYKQFFPYYAKNAYQPEEIAACIKHPATWAKFMIEEFPNFDLTHNLKNIICPVLYLVGQYDCVHPPASAKKTAKGMINAKVKYCEIENTADPVYRDQFEVATNAVTLFLQELGL